jgi:hypothetical protein
VASEKLSVQNAGSSFRQVQNFLRIMAFVKCFTRCSKEELGRIVEGILARFLGLYGIVLSP